jgi:hypothetical protein
MKFSWIKEEMPIPCEIVHQGISRALALHHPSGAHLDEVERTFPALPEDADERAKLARFEERIAFLAVKALGPESFEATDLAGQMHELLHGADRLSSVSILKIVKTARDAAELTPEKLEAAKDGVRPIESAV